MNKIEYGFCTAGGTLLSTLALTTNDLLKTVVFAAIGAMVSFLVTFVLKRVFRKA